MSKKKEHKTGRGDGAKGKLVFVHNKKYLRVDLGSGTNLKAGDRVFVEQRKDGVVELIPDKNNA
jgi:hypothetical protein